MTEVAELHLSRVRRYRIVVGLDLSEYSEVVLEHALDQAARHDAPELHLLTVREKRNPSADEVKQALWEHVYSTLEAFNRHGTEWRARLHVRRGKPDEQIVQLGAEVGADLIVLGQFGLHHPKASRKAVAAKVLANATCPTLVVGMPEAYDAKQCGMCVALRQQSEGELWWCEDHTSSSRRAEHVLTPMTVWSHGKFAIDRAA
ncbi:MAG: universal stress protein [Deltaproteobacteria bacterium]|nr:universal stress protein [Deltaproteobacteria bacterium]